MRLGPSFFVEFLLCLFICRCYGAPPKDVGQPSSSGRLYTEEEDLLIVEELPKILDDCREGKCKGVWDELARRFSEKLTAGTQGFPQERNARSLRGRFQDVLVYNSPHNEVQVPESLRQMYYGTNFDRTDRGRTSRRDYNDEENKFIIEELRKTSHDTLFGISTLGAIQASHDRKHRAKTKGFRYERTIKSLRKHLFGMKKKGLLPNDVLRKFHIDQEEANLPDIAGGSSSSTPTAQNQQTDVQNTIDGLNDAEITDIYGDILDDPIESIEELDDK